MDNIFKKIKESISRQELPNMPLSAWDDFNTYKEKIDNPRKSLWFPIAIGGLLSLLLLSNLYWWKSSSEIVNTSDAIEKTDTIYITKYINTVEKEDSETQDYIKITKTEYQSFLKNAENLARSLKTVDNLSSQFSDLQESFQKSLLANLSTNQELPIHKTTLVDNSKQLLKSNSKKSLLDNNKRVRLENLLVLKYKFPTLLSYTKTSLPLYNNTSKITILKKKQSFLEKIKPKSISIYSNAGIINALNLTYGNSSGLSYGFGFSTFFSKKVRGNIGFLYSKTKGEIEDISDYPSLPTVIVPENSFLKEVYIGRKSIGALIGFDYLFKPMKQFRPFIGIEYYITNSQYVDLLYEFTGPQGEIKLEADNLTSFSDQSIGLRLGIDINLTQNFDANIGFNYARNIVGDNGNFLYFRTGLQYHF